MKTSVGQVAAVFAKNKFRERQRRNLGTFSSRRAAEKH